MNDNQKTKEELVRELCETRRQNAELQKTVSKLGQENETLRKNTENYNIHFSMANDVMFFYDNQFRILSVSPNVERLLGYKPDEMIGRNFQSLGVLDPIGVNEATDDALQVLSGKQIFSSIYQFITKDGGRKFGEVSGVPLKKDGRVVGSISVARDITTRMLTEEELKKYRDHLEDLVKKRTDELTAANEQLKREIEERKRSEQALQESKEFIRGITENIPGAVYQFYARDNGEVGLNYVSGHTLELLGLDNEPKDFLQRFTACVAPEDREGFLASIQEAVSKRSNLEHEVRFIKPTGGEVYIRGISKPRHIGNELVFDGVLLDITSRRLAQKALKESEGQYRFLTENMTDIVWTANLDFNVTYESPSIEKILGYTPGDRLGQEATKLMTTESRDKAMDVLSNELSRDQDEGVDPTRTVKLQLEYYHKNGSSVWLESLTSIIRDNAGKIIGFHGVSRDITDRKRAEDALRSSVELFSKAFHLSPNPMTILSLKDMKYLDVNESSLKYSGCSREEHLGRAPMDQEIFNKEFISKAIQLLREKGEFHDFEFSFYSKTGEFHIGLLSAITIEINNEPCVLTVTNIITERKLMELELKKHHDKLEELVKERTAELIKANIELKREIEVRKTTETSLKSRELELEKGRQELQEMNSALKVLLKQREEDKVNMEMNIISNIKTSVLPYIEKLELSGLAESQVRVSSMIKFLLEEITSPFIRNVSSEFLSFTPNEIQVASLVKEGKSSKEIAEILNISVNTVHTYRYKIRIKTGLKNNKMNLRSYLQTLG